MCVRVCVFVYFEKKNKRYRRFLGVVNESEKDGFCVLREVPLLCVWRKEA